MQSESVGRQSKIDSGKRTSVICFPEQKKGTKLIFNNVVCFLGMATLFDFFTCISKRLTAYLFPVFLILNGIHSTAWFSI